MALVADYGMSSDESDEDTSVAEEKGGSSGQSSSTAVREEGDEVVEEFLKKTNYGDAVPEKPPPMPAVSGTLSKMRLPNAKKGKIQISIPTIEDSDSDDDQPKVKKANTTISATGFLGSLPAPRASGGGGKEAGRAFIPYTLTKKKETKPVPPKSNITRNKSSKVPKLTETNSDSDDDAPMTDVNGETSANFFSLPSEPSYSSIKTSGSINATPTISNSSSMYVEEEKTTQPKITAASLYNMTDITDDADYSSYNADYAQHNNEKGSNNEIDDLLQNEQFLRLQGKKQRGKEAIDIIDVHTDDQKVSEIELTKNISEEVDPSVYAHRKKGEGPSGQQKRKHHITYLAFQAKERELELKNTWAANKATKQQTQAKYGF